MATTKFYQGKVKEKLGYFMPYRHCHRHHHCHHHHHHYDNDNNNNNNYFLSIIHCLLQRANKVVSDSPGLVDFATGLVNSVFNLPDRQVMFFEKFQ